MPDIEIVRATIHDAPRVAAMLALAFAPLEELYTPEAFRATVVGPAEIARRIAEEGPTWIAVSSGSPIATLSAVAKQRALYLRSMAVVPDAHRRGAGRALLDRAEAHARAEGLERLKLSTTPFLDAAIALYERSGFLLSDEGPHELCGTLLFTMTKRLAVQSRFISSTSIVDASSRNR